MRYKQWNITKIIKSLDNRSLESQTKQIDRTELSTEKSHLVIWITRRSEKASIKDLGGTIDIEIHSDRREQHAIDVAQHLTLTPAVVDVRNGDHIPLARLELVLYAVLHLLAARLGAVGEHKARAHEERRVADALARA